MPNNIDISPNLVIVPPNKGSTSGSYRTSYPGSYHAQFMAGDYTPPEYPDLTTKRYAQLTGRKEWFVNMFPNYTGYNSWAQQGNNDYQAALDRYNMSWNSPANQLQQNRVAGYNSLFSGSPSDSGVHSGGSPVEFNQQAQDLDAGSMFGQVFNFLTGLQGMKARAIDMAGKELSNQALSQQLRMNELEISRRSIVNKFLEPFYDLRNKGQGLTNESRNLSNNFTRWLQTGSGIDPTAPLGVRYGLQNSILGSSAKEAGFMSGDDILGLQKNLILFNTAIQSLSYQEKQKLFDNVLNPMINLELDNILTNKKANKLTRATLDYKLKHNGFTNTMDTFVNPLFNLISGTASAASSLMFGTSALGRTFGRSATLHTLGPNGAWMNQTKFGGW